MPFNKGLAGSGGPQWQVGADGWTTFHPSWDSKVVYVDSTGGTVSSDSYTGLSQTWDGVSPTSAGPKATIKGAYAVTRDGYPDHILLKRGQDHVQGFGANSSDGFGGFTANTVLGRSGRSRNEPFVIGNYGSLSLGRPRALPVSNRVQEYFLSTISGFGQNLAVQGIEMYMPSQDPTSPSFRNYRFTGTVTSGTATITNIVSTTNLVVGMTLCGPGVNTRTIQSIDVTTPGSGQITMNGTSSYNATAVEISAFFNQLGGIGVNGHVGFTYIEDCFFNYVGLGLNHQNVKDDVEIHLNRNIFAYSYLIDILAHGVYMADYPRQRPDVRHKISDNFFYQNGWHPDVWGADTGGGRTHNGYCHDIHWGHDFTGNITARAGTNGWMQRNGGTSFNNAFLENAYGGVWGTGIRPNDNISSYNTFVHGMEQPQPSLVAVSATGIGVTPASITFAGVPSNTSGTSDHASAVYNLDNPGSLARNATMAAGGKVLSLNGAIAAGTRGNGVQAGDRIVAYNSICSGWSVGPAFAIPLANKPGTSSYSTGESGPFYVALDSPIPPWVSVGYGVTIEHNVGTGPHLKLAPGTTVTSIADNRLSFHASSPILGDMLGGNFAFSLESNNFGPQAGIAFWDTVGGSEANYPVNRFGPNIICNATAQGTVGYGLDIKGNSMYCDATGNYFYKWNSSTAANIADRGIGSIISPQALNSNTTVTAYDAATVEGYMTSLGITPATREEFYTRCFANRQGNWDSRFTAAEFNTYIRGCFGASEP